MTAVDAGPPTFGALAEDGDLVLRHRWGDAAAFDEIHQRYRGWSTTSAAAWRVI